MGFNLIEKIIDRLEQKSELLEEKINNKIILEKNPNVEITYKSVQEILKKNNNIKLHIGCGTVYKDGWINIDNNSDNNIRKLDLIWDLRNFLPFPDNSVDFIYNEHFLEHLSVQEGLRALMDFKRVLKPNGVLRIAMPDLAETIKDYLNPNWKTDKAEFYKKFGLDFIQTKAEKINIAFRWWGHQWLYDWEELERRLKEVGFDKIKQEKLRHSEHIDLQNLETRDESILIAEAVK